MSELLSLLEEGWALRPGHFDDVGHDVGMAQPGAIQRRRICRKCLHRVLFRSVFFEALWCHVRLKAI